MLLRKHSTQPPSQQHCCNEAAEDDQGRKSSVHRGILFRLTTLPRDQFDTSSIIGVLAHAVIFAVAGIGDAGVTAPGYTRALEGCRICTLGTARTVEAKA